MAAKRFKRYKKKGIKSGSSTEGRLSKRMRQHGAAGKAQPTTNYDKERVKFCFAYVIETGKGGFNELDEDMKSSIMTAMVKRREQTWAEAKLQGRHKQGMENIDRDSMALSLESMPEHIKMRKKFIAFRYHGMMAMVGFRENDVFYPLGFDANFHNKSVYGH